MVVPDPLIYIIAGVLGFAYVGIPTLAMVYDFASDFIFGRKKGSDQ